MSTPWLHSQLSLNIAMIVSLGWCFFPIQSSAQVLTDEVIAFNQARLKRVPVLLVFSGSDWCQPCLRFQKNVIEDPAFADYARQNLMLLKADFPQRKKLPQALVRQNENLAERFNKSGQFPKIVLLDENKNFIAEVPYHNEPAHRFIEILKQDIPHTPIAEYKRNVPLMGSFFEFILVDSTVNEIRCQRLIDKCISEVNRIEHLISEWIDTTQVSRLNKLAGKRPLSVDAELYDLIKRSKALGDLTQGAFDISFLPLTAIWKFDGTQQVPPDSGTVRNTLRHVGYQHIQLLPGNKVFLPSDSMAIGFGGIGQGYAVDRVKSILRSAGVQNFMLNSSGDIYAQGKRGDGSSWKVGIADPFNKTKVIRWLPAENTAVVTSGNYEKFFEYNGLRYAHIINPKTGYPVQDVVSVTIINPITEIGDALATAVFVLGVEAGLHLVEQFPGTHCIIIDRHKNIHYSKDLQANE